jgi:hypothetical protein
MKVRKYLYPLNHTWVVLVDAARDDEVPAERKGRLLGEFELDAAHVGADLDEVRRRLAEHGHCLNQPAAKQLRQPAPERRSPRREAST